MTEKKYIGNGKQMQYSTNIDLNLNQLFNQIKTEENKKDLATAFIALKKALDGQVWFKKFKYKTGEEENVLKFTIAELKNPTEYKTHTVYLNEYEPKKQDATNNATDKKNVAETPLNQTDENTEEEEPKKEEATNNATDKKNVAETESVNFYC